MTLALALIAIVAVVGTARAADEIDTSAAAAAEFQRIATAHRDLRAYDLQIDAVVETNGVSVPLQATLKCDDQRRCVRTFQNSTTLETPDLSLMVDTAGRTITVNRHGSLAANASMASTEPSKALEAWLKDGGRLSGGELTPMGRHWTLDVGRPASVKAHMYVDSASYLLRRFVYQSERRDGTRSTVDIRYTWRDAGRLDPAEFSTSRFIEDQRGNIAPARAYAGYRILSTNR